MGPCANPTTCSGLYPGQAGLHSLLPVNRQSRQRKISPDSRHLCLSSFISWQIGQTGSNILPMSPVRGLLKQCSELDPGILKPKPLHSFCQKARLQADDKTKQKQKPPQWTLSYNTIGQMDQFCKKERKQLKVPYVQLLLLKTTQNWVTVISQIPLF